MVKTKKVKPAKAGNLTSNETLTAVLSYLGILFIIPLLIVKKNERNDFIKFHLAQGIVLFIAVVVIGIAQGILAFIPIIGWIISVIIINLLWLAILIVVIIAIVKGLQGEKWEIPVIYNLAKNMKL